jgi:hypothetical protein
MTTSSSMSVNAFFSDGQFIGTLAGLAKEYVRGGPHRSTDFRLQVGYR